MEWWNFQTFEEENQPAVLDGKQKQKRLHEVVISKSFRLAEELMLIVQEISLWREECCPASARVGFVFPLRASLAHVELALPLGQVVGEELTISTVAQGPL